MVMVPEAWAFFERNREPDIGALNKLVEWQQTHPMSSDRIERLKNRFQQKKTGRRLAQPHRYPKILAVPTLHPATKPAPSQ